MAHHYPVLPLDDGLYAVITYFVRHRDEVDAPPPPRRAPGGSDPPRDGRVPSQTDLRARLLARLGR